MKMPRRGVIGRFGFCDRGRRVEGLFYRGIVMVKLRWARLVFGLQGEKKRLPAKNILLALTKVSDTSILNQNAHTVK
jgi:hypothetical protein